MMKAISGEKAPDKSQGEHHLLEQLPMLNREISVQLWMPLLFCTDRRSWGCAG